MAEPRRHADPLDLANALPPGERVLLCLDYDGTLVPFEDDVRRAATPPEVRTLLADLAAEPRFSVAIVTGRSMDDILARLDPPGASHAAEHGKDVRHADGWARRFEPEPEVQAALDRIVARWGALAAEDPRVFFMRKPASATLSSRRFPSGARAALEERARACGAEEAAAGLVRFTEGQGLVELRPRGGWTKATAVAMLAEHERATRGAATRVLFIGDDRTDEDALEALSALAPATGIRVAADATVPTAADHVLADVAAVLAFLRELRRLTWATRGSGSG
ncbi:MAG: trehalose-phosphatase [Candidatus Sumerlaeia bacterium]|nr:trehalose-phosphatase [Candidatus Sumerlaeia bacterium]